MYNLTFLLLTTVIVSETSQEAPMLSLSIFLAALSGYAIRLGMDIQNKQLSWSRTLIQVLYIIGLSWFGLNMWPLLETKWPVTTYVFFVSVFGVFLVGLLNSIVKQGLTTYFKGMLKKLLADEEIKEENHD